MTRGNNALSEEDDQIGRLIRDGWSVKGYSTAMMAAGAITHSILLQRDMDVVTVNIVKAGAKEIGRTLDVFSPPPAKAKAKGWFS